jgi:membrane protein
MMLLGLLVGTAVVLAGLVYVAKRHFGLPVMGLAVGMVVTQLWAADVVPYAAGVGIGIDRSALLAVVTIVLTVLPAVILVCCGSVVSQRWWRIGGSLIFGVVATYVLVGALSSLVPPVDETSKTVMAVLDGSHAVVVTIGFALALVDTLVARTKGAKPHKKK